VPEIVIRERARLDVEEQAAFFAKDSIERAARFLDQFDHAVRRLLRFPRLGRAWPTQNASLRGLRRLTMTGFPLSVFYRSSHETIEIIRVLHHSRDLPPDLQDL
jgi:plasmid stabilization system protein ParE